MVQAPRYQVLNRSGIVKSTLRSPVVGQSAALLVHPEPERAATARAKPIDNLTPVGPKTALPPVRGMQTAAGNDRPKFAPTRTRRKRAASWPLAQGLVVTLRGLFEPPGEHGEALVLRDRQFNSVTASFTVEGDREAMTPAGWIGDLI